MEFNDYCLRPVKKVQKNFPVLKVLLLMHLIKNICYFKIMITAVVNSFVFSGFTARD